jgi:hypothetical protein
MRELESKLAYYKMILNSSYGTMNVTDVYSEVFKLRCRVNVIKARKCKIKKLFQDGR